MLLGCQPKLWVAVCALMIAAGCETDTDSDQQQVPPPQASQDTTAPIRAPAPADTDAGIPPAVPAPDNGHDAGTTPPADPSRSVIPAVYRGRWDSNAAACARSTNEMRLNVSASSLNFYEGSSRVLAVRNVSGGIEVDVEHTAEGTTDRRTYRLATSGNQLTVTIEGHAATRVRCS